MLAGLFRRAGSVQGETWVGTAEVTPTMGKPSDEPCGRGTSSPLGGRGKQRLAAEHSSCRRLSRAIKQADLKIIFFYHPEGFRGPLGETCRTAAPRCPNPVTRPQRHAAPARAPRGAAALPGRGSPGACPHHGPRQAAAAGAGGRCWVRGRGALPPGPRPPPRAAPWAPPRPVPRGRRGGGRAGGGAVRGGGGECVKGTRLPAVT